MQAELLQIAANAVTAKLIGASRDTKLLVSQMLSYEVEGAERNEQFRAGNWDGRSSFFDFRSESQSESLERMEHFATCIKPAVDDFA